MFSPPNPAGRTSSTSIAATNSHSTLGTSQKTGTATLQSILTGGTVSITVSIIGCSDRLCRPTALGTVRYGEHYEATYLEVHGHRDAAVDPFPAFSHRVIHVRAVHGAATLGPHPRTLMLVVTTEPGRTSTRYWTPKLTILPPA